MRPRRIATLPGLMAAAKLRLAIVCPESHSFAKPKPAAWMIHLPGVILARLLESGIYVYTPKRKTSRPWKLIWAGRA